MPELPEVETIRAELAPRLAGSRIVEAWGRPAPKFEAAAEVIGASIDGVGRRGKYLVVGLDDRRRLIIHLGMTGRLAIRNDDDLGDHRHLRAWWRLDGRGTFTFHDVRQFGRLAVVDADGPTGLATFDALGPEPLEPGFDGEPLWRHAKRSKQRIKTQLLSQRPVAGVGNIYADEALWMARIHPGARSLSRPRAEALAGSLVEVLSQAVDHDGTTLRDYRTLDGETGGHQFHLRCYGRSGEPCERCATTMVRRVYDGRSTTMCPTCQTR